MAFALCGRSTREGGGERETKLPKELILSRWEIYFDLPSPLDRPFPDGFLIFNCRPFSLSAWIAKPAIANTTCSRVVFELRLLMRPILFSLSVLSTYCCLHKILIFPWAVIWQLHPWFINNNAIQVHQWSIYWDRARRTNWPTGYNYALKGHI